MEPLLTLDTREVKKSALSGYETDCLILPVQGKAEDDPLLQALDASGDIAAALNRARGAPAVLFPLTTGLGAKQLLLVKTNPRAGEATAQRWIGAMQGALARLHASGAVNASVMLRDPALRGRDIAWCAQQIAQLAEMSCYHYRLTLSSDNSAGAKQDDKSDDHSADSKRSLQSLMLLLEDGAELEASAEAARLGAGIGLGANTARELGDLPPNICNPAFLMTQARQMAKEHDCLEIEVLEQQQMEKEGMHSLLSVSQGSVQPPFLFRLRYRGAGSSSATCALVGKGVTFDTGGISLKPAGGMADMKYDMSGAGSVIGAMRALAELRPKVNVDGVIATVENMPGSRATRPGDVVSSLSGQTVEILNTDAEGRLILCDALTWAARENPDIMIDIATLTGACVVALGHEACALYSNDESLADDLLRASDYSNDRAWRMPLWEEYDQLLKSRYADVANIGGGRAAGSITAACFLQRFVGKRAWAHLDVAGTAHKGGDARASTGRPVPLLMQFLLQRSG